MRKMIAIVGLALAIGGCQDNEDSAKTDELYTGNQSVYALQPGSAYSVSGTVTFKELKDGSATVNVALSGTEGNVLHPVHLHLGDITVDGANVAALLNPVTGKTGTSETHLIRLADESVVTYKQLAELDACVKVHLSATGPDQNVVLAGGNIGSAATKISPSGRTAIGVCK